MVRIKFNLRELKILLDLCQNIEFDKKAFVDFDNQEIETIVNEISNVFIKKGLKCNFEPNIYGKELESLIDKFVSAQQKEHK